MCVLWGSSIGRRAGVEKERILEFPTMHAKSWPLIKKPLSSSLPSGSHRHVTLDKTLTLQNHHFSLFNRKMMLFVSCRSVGEDQVGDKCGRALKQ